LLIFSYDQLPQLTKGKGNKLISIPKAEFEKQAEYVVAAVCFEAVDILEVYSGKRMMVLREDLISGYSGNRAQRGKFLPRGFRKVDALQVRSPEKVVDEEDQ